MSGKLCPPYVAPGHLGMDCPLVAVNPEEQPDIEALWKRVFHTTQPTAAQRRFNAIWRSDPGFLRGSFKPTSPQEFYQALELCLAAWPLVDAGLVLHQMTGPNLLRTSEPVPFDSAELTPRTGAELIAYLEHWRQVRRQDYRYRGSRTTQEKRAGLHWLAQCGARFGDIVQARTRQYPVQALVTDCDVEIGSVGATRGVPQALMFGLTDKGPVWSWVACDPLSTPSVVFRPEDGDLLELLWMALRLSGARASHLLKHLSLSFRLNHGWVPPNNDVARALKFRYLDEGRPWRETHPQQFALLRAWMQASLA